MELSALFDHLTKLYRPYIKITQPLLEAHDLHPAQWLILKDIYTHPQTTLVQISKRRSIEKPTTRKILKVLDERGWLLSQPGEDKREKLLTLSEQGEIVYHSLMTEIHSQQADITAKLQLTPAEIEQTIQLLDQLYNSMTNKIQRLES